MQPPPKGELIIRSKYDVYLDGKTLTYVKSPCAHDDAGNRFILHVIPVDTSVIEGRISRNLGLFLYGRERLARWRGLRRLSRPAELSHCLHQDRSVQRIRERP